MKKIALVLLIVFHSTPSKAFLFGAFGGDAIVLSQILAQAIQQLAQLKQIFGAAKENLDLVRQINQGINDSLNLLKKVQPNLDPGIYRDWENSSDGLGKLQKIYGEIPTSQEAVIQRDTDQSIAEAISFNNSFYKYSSELDSIGEQIQSASHLVSPGGAQKLSAQALGLLIQVLNQNLRAESTLLKLQAQDLALKNRKEKSETQSFLDVSQGLSDAIKSERVTFAVPRF